jgi:hypothetical protein
MTIQGAGQLGLKAVQAKLKVSFVAPASHKSPKTQPRSEPLRRKMIGAGGLLIDALCPERDFTENEGQERWKTYRMMVDHMAEEYASAVDAWREAVEEDFRLAKLSPRTPRKTRKIL